MTMKNADKVIMPRCVLSMRRSLNPASFIRCENWLSEASQRRIDEQAVAADAQVTESEHGPVIAPEPGAETTTDPT